MDDYLEDIWAEVEINPVEVEYYDSSVATPPMVKRKKLGKTKLLSNDEKKALQLTVTTTCTCHSLFSTCIIGMVEIQYV